jgi:hypothetical protein
MKTTLCNGVAALHHGPSQSASTSDPVEKSGLENPARRSVRQGTRASLVVAIPKPQSRHKS